MSKTQTQTATTVHGEVEYEVVNCDSCGNEVAKNDAKTILIGNYHGKKNWTHEDYVEWYLADADKGWICPYCHGEGGIIETPNTAKINKWVRHNPELSMVFGAVGIFALLVFTLIIF